MSPSLFLMALTVSCSGAKLQLELNGKFQPNHSQNLSLSRRVHKLCGAFSRERWKSYQRIWVLQKSLLWCRFYFLPSARISVIIFIVCILEYALKIDNLGADTSAKPMSHKIFKIPHYFLFSFFFSLKLSDRYWNASKKGLLVKSFNILICLHHLHFDLSKSLWNYSLVSLIAVLKRYT